LHQIAGNLVGHLLSRGHDVWGSLLQGGEEIGPETHQGAFLLGKHPLTLQMGGTTLTMPEGLAMLAGMLALGETRFERGGAGIAIELAETSRHQQFAGVHGGDSIDTAEVGEAEPLTGQGGGGDGATAVAVAGGGRRRRRPAARRAGGGGGAAWCGHGWTNR
jgi:hypothetical protein